MSNLRLSPAQFIDTFPDPHLRHAMRSRVDIIEHDATRPSEPTFICGECILFDGSFCYHHKVGRRYTERACITGFERDSGKAPSGMQISFKW